MRNRAWVVLLVVAWLGATAGAKTVACVGDSITYGGGTEPYPAQLGRMLQAYDSTWKVSNFGVSGATLLRSGDLPYWNQSAYQSALASQPDIVTIMLGTNDSKPQNWKYKDQFVADYCLLIDTFQALASKPRIWICKPIPATTQAYGINGTIIHDEMLPMIDEIARLRNVPVIDTYAAMVDHVNLLPDGIHPNTEGNTIIAETMAPYLLGVRAMPDFNRDGWVNLVDFAVLAQNWMSSEAAFDIAPPPDGDGNVNFGDLKGLSEYWLDYPNLVTYWRLDETDGGVAADVCGHANGVLHGAPVWRPDSGRVGGALEFDGVDDSVTSALVLKPSDGPFTVFLWVKGGKPGQAILSQATLSGTGLVWLGADAATGALQTALIDGGRATKPLVSATSIVDGNWHFLRFVWDGARRRLYVDDREAAADASDLNQLRESSGGFYLGTGEHFTPGTYWSGLIDDVRFYSQALKP
jgi:acyl-CoA thioesterase-1